MENTKGPVLEARLTTETTTDGHNGRLYDRCTQMVTRPLPGTIIKKRATPDPGQIRAENPRIVQQTDQWGRHHHPHHHL